jgi:hypothetical protein
MSKKKDLWTKTLLWTGELFTATLKNYEAWREGERERECVGSEDECFQTLK